MGKRRKKKNKKNIFSEDVSFGRASIFTICLSFFFSFVVIGTCLMSQFTMERYARTKVAEAKVLLEDWSSPVAIIPGSIDIGDGVELSSSCRVGKSEIFCK